MILTQNYRERWKTQDSRERRGLMAMLTFGRPSRRPMASDAAARAIPRSSMTALATVQLW
jgi:hypothetical protein